MSIEGVWLPVVTPFVNGDVDYVSYRNLIDHYVATGISGILPLGTTGESPTIDDYEYERIIDKTVEYVNNRVPVYIGAGGNNTAHVVKIAATVEKYAVEGILSVCPYYNRPDQRGIYEHFLKISESTRLNIIIYNIPYRTGRNIENATMHKLAGLKNVVGVKDSCGDMRQTMELLLNPPPDFSILTGEDMHYYLTLALGGQGGILASAHLRTGEFVDMYTSVRRNDHKAALETWRGLAEVIPLLFAEPNPAPVKYWLKKAGLIASAETRLPLVRISDELERLLDGTVDGKS